MLLPSLHRPLVVRRGPIIWRRAAASDVIWRSTVEYRRWRAIFCQGRAWYAKFEASLATVCLRRFCNQIDPPLTRPQQAITSNL